MAGMSSLELLKTAGMAYGGYKTMSLSFGNSSLNALPGDITTTAGNTIAAGSVIGYGLTQTGIPKYLNKVASTGLLSSSKRLAETGVFNKTTEGMRFFNNENLFSGLFKIGKFTAPAEEKVGYGLAFAGKKFASSLELLGEMAPGTFGKALAVGATALIGSRVIGSIFDSMFGAQR